MVVMERKSTLENEQDENCENCDLVNFRAQGHEERDIEKINEEHYMNNMELKWDFLRRRNSCNLRRKLNIDE